MPWYAIVKGWQAWVKRLKTKPSKSLEHLVPNGEGMPGVAGPTWRFGMPNPASIRAVAGITSVEHQILWNRDICYIYYVVCIMHALRRVIDYYCILLHICQCFPPQGLNWREQVTFLIGHVGLRCFVRMALVFQQPSAAFDDHHNADAREQPRGLGAKWHRMALTMALSYLKLTFREENAGKILPYPISFLNILEFGLQSLSILEARTCGPTTPAAQRSERKRSIGRPSTSKRRKSKSSKKQKVSWWRNWAIVTWRLEVKQSLLARAPDIPRLPDLLRGLKFCHWCVMFPFVWSLCSALSHSVLGGCLENTATASTVTLNISEHHLPQKTCPTCQPATLETNWCLSSLLHGFPQSMGKKQPAAPWPQ